MHTVDPNFLQGLSAGTWKFGTLPTGMPEYPFEVGVFTDMNQADTSTLNNYASVSKLGVMAKYIFVSKFAFVKKHNSDLDTKKSGIIKLTGATS
jgi:hypothetical protein